VLYVLIKSEKGCKRSEMIRQLCSTKMMRSHEWEDKIAQSDIQPPHTHQCFIAFMLTQTIINVKARTFCLKSSCWIR